ncbi:MAG: Uma2 family endonuclease [Gloeocapsa sp. DLM2.Bin57]|nr:MAG: Uma2 family endonuclease [Gloeocapsa sp. DLM2.Bin57]
MTKINLYPIKDQISAKFAAICQENPNLSLELSATGELRVMSPTGGETGRQNAYLLGLFFVWNQANQLGVLFDSSTCFRLSNGALFSPDLAWVTLERWNNLSKDEQQKFPPLAPDFVLELLSPSDSLPQLQNKMREYLQGGVPLGWLLNPNLKSLEIYRLNSEVEILSNPLTIAAEKILPGLVINLTSIWG